MKMLERIDTPFFSTKKNVWFFNMEQIGEIKIHANDVIMCQLKPFIERVQFPERVRFLDMRKQIVTIRRKTYVVRSVFSSNNDIQTSILKIAEKKALQDMGLKYSTLC